MFALSLLLVDFVASVGLSNRLSERLWSDLYRHAVINGNICRLKGSIGMKRELAESDELVFNQQ